MLVVEGTLNGTLPRAPPLPKILLERIPQTMLSAHLISFGAKDLAKPHVSGPDDVILEEILAASPRLRELRLDFRGGYRIHTHGQISKRLPPLEHLHLCGYFWAPPMGPVSWTNSNWDMSSLTHLELMESDTRCFFRSVPPSSFAHLRSLKIHTWPKLDGAASLDLTDDVRQHAAEFRIAIDHMHALEELHITCLLSALPLSAITRHGPTLRSLILYDHARYESSPSISENHLESIRSSCPHLMTLGLNLRNCNFKVRLQSNPRIWRIYSS